MLFLLSLLFSCEDDKSSDDTGGPPPCAVVEGTFPAEGATDVDLGADVSFTLSLADDSATITSDVPGTVITTPQADGLGIVVHYVPDAILAAGTSPHFELEWCGGIQTLDFSTLSVGTAPPAEALSDVTWVVDLKAAHVVAPVGAGDTIIGELVIPPILLSPVSADPLHIRGGMARTDATAQDWCAETLDFTDVDYSAAPYFTMSAEKMTIPVSGTASDVYDIRIAGVISADGTTLEHGTLWGKIDMRQAAVPTGYSEEELCTQLLPQLSTYCEECPDGEPYCLTLGFDGITAATQAGTIDAVAGLDCAGCETAPPEEATCGE